jgi:pyridoxine kinase
MGTHAKTRTSANHIMSCFAYAYEGLAASSSDFYWFAQPKRGASAASLPRTQVCFQRRPPNLASIARRKPCVSVIQGPTAPMVSMPTLLSISSHVIRGTVGGTLAAFVMRCIGQTVWEVPTVVWDHHPGLGKPSGLTLTGGQITALLADFQAPAQAAETALIVTGYFANRGQIDAAADHVRTLRAAGHGVRVCCDPVCGDAPGLYVAPEVLAGLRNVLVPLADFVTPNRHELGFLTGLPVTSHAEIVTAARALGRPVCLVTSAFSPRHDLVANVLVTPDRVWRCIATRQPDAPNGTGDLMTALFAGWIAAGCEIDEALGRASAGVESVLHVTRGLGRLELAIAEASKRYADGKTSHGVAQLPPNGALRDGE